MAKFEGVQWAPKQFQYLLKSGESNTLEAEATTFAISRTIHYGLCQVFEGIRFFCSNTEDGLEIRFLNLQHNLQRFRSGISYSISVEHQKYVPDEDSLRRIFIENYFQHPSLRNFLLNMASVKAQGYFRPFTLDEAQSIGVTFPEEPSIRASLCSYDRYLGEPFVGVVIPSLVRAVSTNGTGCLKLGSNYLISVKAVQLAQTISNDANAALFLDDRPDLPYRERNITEWDSSCCLIALRDGRIIKIPEGPMILPSVTIKGVTSLIRKRGVTVEEQQVSYGQFLDWASTDNIICICSIGTAGILNRCSKLVLVDSDLQQIAIHEADVTHHLYQLLSEIRHDYWRLFLGEIEIPNDLVLEKHIL
jgi:branched-chain amino acid aminotransferase